MSLLRKSVLIGASLFALGISSNPGTAGAQARRPAAGMKLFEMPFSNVKDIWLLPNQLCALETSGTYSCFGHDYPTGGFRAPPSVQPEETIVGLAVLPSEVCLQVSDRRSTSIRCGAVERYGEPSAAVPLVYQDEAALWDFLVNSKDPYACRLDKAAEQTARSFFAGLDPRKVLIDQGRMTACAIAGSNSRLKCLSCSGRLLSNDQSLVRSAVDETRKGFEFFQVANGGETRFGHYAVDTGEIIWPKNKVIQGKDAERFKVQISSGQFAGSNSIKWISVSDPVASTHQMIEDPWHHKLGDWEMPMFEKDQSKEWSSGIWLRTEIDAQGKARLYRNLPVEVSNLDRFPRQVRLFEKVINQSSLRNLKTYSAPFFTYAYPSPDRSDTQGNSDEQEEANAPFGELSCVQLRTAKTPTAASKDEVHCWGVDNHGLLIRAPPEELVEIFSVGFDGELVQYDLGSHILCGIEKKNGKRKLRCFGIDEKGVAGEIYSYSLENVKEVAAGYQHVSFITDSDKLLHFNFRDGLKEEVSPLSGQGLSKLTAHSKHTCAVSEKQRGVICETKEKQTLAELLSSKQESPFRARLVGRGEVGWPIYDLTTSFGQVALISNRGLETWKAGPTTVVLQILSDSKQTTVPAHSR